MDRLSTLLALTLLLGLAGTANGQAVRFTVAGDVANPGTLAHDDVAGGQSVYLKDLLKKAGAQTDGIACILRGDLFQGGFSEFVSAQMAGKGSQLANGDIVVFHRSSGPADTASHVLVIVDAIPRVVPLADIGNRMGSLLAIFGLALPADTMIPVVRTERGSAARRHVTRNQALAHGDVVLLNKVARIDPGRVSELFRGAATETTAPSGRTFKTVSDERLAEKNFDLGKPVALTLPAGDFDSGESAAETLQIPVLRAAMETIIPHDAGAMAQPGVDIVPVANPLADGVTAATEASPLWNGVFIFGFLGALALIVTGWMKTNRESSTSNRPAAASGTFLRPPQEIPNSAASIKSSSADGNEFLSASSTSDFATVSDSQPAISAGPIGKVTTVASAGILPAPPQELDLAAGSDGLVEEQEWFGRDWRDNTTTTSASVVHVDLAEPVQELELLPVLPWEISDNQTTAAVMASESTAADAELPYAADDLEDLIHNRLPVELQQAELPLRVTLFGRPAGPRRLRIDAAHTEIAAPNFAASSRARRESSQKVTGAPALEEQHGDDAASLDRALNSLHEQGH